MTRIPQQARRAAAIALLAGLAPLAGCTIERSSDRAETAAAGDTARTVPGSKTEIPGTTTDATGGATGGVGAAGGVTASAPGTLDSLVDPTKVKPEDRPRAELRLEVDVRARQLRVLRGGEGGGSAAATFPVGVGTAEWPTQPGTWVVSQVVFNPEFIPPDQSWAEESERKAPGAPDNPLGEAQLIYDPPRTIHGTDKPASVGKAQSHGSIRMRNEDVVRLAREVMTAAGVSRDESWYQEVRRNRTQKQVVDLPRVVPIVVR